MEVRRRSNRAMAEDARSQADGFDDRPAGSHQTWINA
jgi:hypothetical protein